jgi:CRP-like cAMP-binding protein
MSEPMTDHAARSFLASTGMLAKFPVDFVEAVLGAGFVRRLDQGEALQTSADDNCGFWGMADGQAAYYPGQNSPGASLGSLVWPGEWGGFAPLMGEARLGDCIATVPTTVLWVPLHRARQILESAPQWWRHIASIYAQWAARALLMQGDLQVRNSRARMAAVLLSVSNQRRVGEEPRTLMLTQEEVGEIANLSRHPAGQILHEFQQAGLVRLGYRGLTIVSPAALREIADRA